jgi:hypothetical protein
MIGYELSAQTTTLMAERAILKNLLGREIENIALSAIVSFAAG